MEFSQFCSRSWQDHLTLFLEPSTGSKHIAELVAHYRYQRQVLRHRRSKSSRFTVNRLPYCFSQSFRKWGLRSALVWTLWCILTRSKIRIRDKLTDSSKTWIQRVLIIELVNKFDNRPLNGLRAEEASG